ncbi:hypothetical protein ACHAXT_002549 [Thalassiosira profunda]
MKLKRRGISFPRLRVGRASSKTAEKKGLTDCAPAGVQSTNQPNPASRKSLKSKFVKLLARKKSYEVDGPVIMTYTQATNDGIVSLYNVGQQEQATHEPWAFGCGATEAIRSKTPEQGTCIDSLQMQLNELRAQVNVMSGELDHARFEKKAAVEKLDKMIRRSKKQQAEQADLEEVRFILSAEVSESMMSSWSPTSAGPFFSSLCSPCMDPTL